VWWVNCVFIGLQLYCEVKWKCKHFLNYIFAYHIDSTTLADGDYKLIPESEVEISDDPGNVVENLIEAPNQSSENLDTPAPNPAHEGKPQCITQYLLYYNFMRIYIIFYIKSRSWNETLDAWILGTYELCLRPYRIDALLIGPVEVGWFPVTRMI
jgi:hypothetical protein